MAEDKDWESAETAVTEFHKRIKEAFEVFDHESNNTVDVREIGTIIRSLGCCPSEGELHDLIADVRRRRRTHWIHPIRKISSSDDRSTTGKKVLDPAKRGFLTKEELVKYMTEEGEPFSQEEMEEMLSAAIDPESNSIHYKDYISMMVVDEN
ncbi:dynein regulatory complex protein 8 isoform X3 [Tenrec ecaudatus]|uniref:dynein regulatory complex protein 8 isoform X3 n=1 Tax=Tenrec ecaudatus TaxID=94439 RepID=UPI003F5ABEED